VSVKDIHFCTLLEISWLYVI